jgi:tRNA(Ser,Leu) C12 N-acetylase TAN1
MFSSIPALATLLTTGAKAWQIGTAVAGTTLMVAGTAVVGTAVVKGTAKGAAKAASNFLDWEDKLIVRRYVERQARVNGQPSSLAEAVAAEIDRQVKEGKLFKMRPTAATAPV